MSSYVAEVNVCRYCVDLRRPGSRRGFDSLHPLHSIHLTRMNRGQFVGLGLHALISFFTQKLLRLSPAAMALAARRRCSAGSSRKTNLPLNFFALRGSGSG